VRSLFWTHNFFLSFDENAVAHVSTTAKKSQFTRGYRHSVRLDDAEPTMGSPIDPNLESNPDSCTLEYRDADLQFLQIYAQMPCADPDPSENRPRRRANY
jgi:hypothetical protein